MVTHVELWNSLSLSEYTLEELIDLSTAIDSQKVHLNSSKSFCDTVKKTASIICELMNNSKTAEIGVQLYRDINSKILELNSQSVEGKNEQLLEQVSTAAKKVGFFKIINTHTGYRFVFFASNGEVLATSESYSKYDTCLLGIESMKRNAVGNIEDQTEGATFLPHPKFEIYIDRQGEYRFRLKAKNGAIIVVSEGYKEKSACLQAITRLKIDVNTDDIEKHD